MTNYFCNDKKSSAYSFRADMKRNHFLWTLIVIITMTGMNVKARKGFIANGGSVNSGRVVGER